MRKNDYKNSISYKPAFFVDMARILLPRLQKILPSKFYGSFFNFLYYFYKKGVRFLYAFRILKARVRGDMNDAIKARLTFALLPYTMGGRKALENAFDIIALVEQKKVEGAIVECGVAQGGTAAMMALTNRELGGIARLKWFFDSYEGLPEPTMEDYKDGKAGLFVQPLAKGACLGTLDQVQNLMFEKLLLSRNEVHLVKGWFQDTLPVYRERVGPIAVLRLDGDWYESTKIPLENFYDQVVTGGYVIIDDYATCFGSRKATDEFRVNHNIKSPLLPDGRGGAWFEKQEKNK